MPCSSLQWPEWTLQAAPRRRLVWLEVWDADINRCPLFAGGIEAVLDCNHMDKSPGTEYALHARVVVSLRYLGHTALGISQPDPGSRPFHAVGSSAVN